MFEKDNYTIGSQYASLFFIDKTTDKIMLIIRFQLDETERYKVSRVFADAAAYVKPKEGTGPRNREYLPV